MSRVGKKPIPILDDVTVALDGRTVHVEGPKGKLQWTHRPEITVRVDDSAETVVVTRGGDDRLARSLHGLTRSLIANMVEGCAKGFSKDLEVYGVGYGVRLEGGKDQDKDRKLTLTCGLSHEVVFEVPAGLSVEVRVAQARGDSEPARLTIQGADKQAVGEFAARIRKTRPPEPYKGKGVRYAGEHIRRKVGKAFVGAGQ